MRLQQGRQQKLYLAYLARHYSVTLLKIFIMLRCIIVSNKIINNIIPIIIITFP